MYVGATKTNDTNAQRYSCGTVDAVEFPLIRILEQEETVITHYTAIPKTLFTFRLKAFC